MIVPPAPKPPRDFAMDGSRETRRYRLRPRALGIVVAIEQLIEYRDGSSRWEKVRWPSTVEFGECDDS